MKRKNPLKNIPYRNIAMAAAFGALAYNTDIDDYKEAIFPEKSPLISYSDFRELLDAGQIGDVLIDQNSGMADIRVLIGFNPDNGSGIFSDYRITLPDNFDHDIIIDNSPHTDIVFHNGDSVFYDKTRLFLQALVLLYTGQLTGQWISGSLKNAWRGRKDNPDHDEDYKKKTAYHEAGHAVVGTALIGHSGLDFVTAIPGNGYLGLASFEVSKKNSTKTQYINHIAMVLAGSAAEDLIYGEYESGIISDYTQANQQARHIVTKLGMGERTGLRTYDDNIVIRKGYNLRYILAQFNQQNISEQALREIEEDVKDILDQSMALAIKTIEENLPAIHEVADELMKKKRLSGAEVKAIVDKHNPELALTASAQDPDPVSIE